MTYLSECLTDSPTWILALDEASGATASDSSGNGNDGTYAGSPDYQYREIIGGVDVARFYGHGNTVTLDAANNVSPPYTIECWVQANVLPPLDTTTSSWGFGTTGDTAPRIGLEVAAGSPSLLSLRAPTTSSFVTLALSSSNVGTQVNSGVFSVYNRNHVALVVEASAVYAYVNGELVASNIYVTPVSWNAALSVLGTTYGTWGYIALYESALSASRIEAHYRAATRVIDSNAVNVLQPEDGLDVDEDAVVTKPVSPDFDGATITDTAQMTVLLADTDSLTVTDANGSIAYNFYDTDTATIGSSTNSRTDPNIAVTDLARVTERAAMFPTDPADWPLSPYYDAIIANPTVDISDPAVLYADDPSIYDVVIANPTSDFTTSTTDGTIDHG